MVLASTVVLRSLSEKRDGLVTIPFVRRNPQSKNCISLSTVEQNLLPSDNHSGHAMSARDRRLSDRHYCLFDDPFSR